MASSEARVPSITVLANGSVLPGIIEAEICADSHLAANRFRLQAALNATGADVWTSNEVRVEILLGLDGATASQILGMVDCVEIDPIRGVVHVEGRDLTARFIEARTQETFENRTSSDIATILAIRRGLVPLVAPTLVPVGRNFQNGTARTTFDQFARATTEWDLLTRLAEQEGFDVWVQGQTLNFVPAVQGLTPVAIAPSDCMSMQLRRTTSLAGALGVVVKSWDCRGGQSIVETVSNSVSGSSAGSYVVVRPNLTAEAANKLAQQLLGEMSQHARIISFEMPGDLVIQPRMTVDVIGTNTDFDGLYVVSGVERRMSFHHGFTQFVQARVPPWTIF